MDGKERWLACTFTLSASRIVLTPPLTHTWTDRYSQSVSRGRVDVDRYVRRLQASHIQVGTASYLNTRTPTHTEQTGEKRWQDMTITTHTHTLPLRLTSECWLSIRERYAHMEQPPAFLEV
mmetsp:Transcript_22856/g.56437  ORF Transcript_22856/g.56437 Transcript_22856/m.56437 type:complete len:121 (-) Transcript_22856:323-685(-)